MAKKKKRRGEDEGPNTNVPAGAYGGAEDYGQAEAQMFPPELWEYLKSREQPSETLRTQAQLANPEKYARDQYMAQTYAAPFSGAPGAAFTGRMAADTMTPERIMASQGMGAKNQWAAQLPSIAPENQKALAGKPAAQREAGEFDPDELRRLNEQYIANRSYS